MRIARAFAWLRWRLLANSVRGGRRRDAMEQISRAMALMLPVMIVALSVGTVLVTVALGFVAGRAAATGQFPPERIMAFVRIALAVLTFLVLIFAVSSPAQSSLARYTRLLLLPIPRRTLHLVEVGAAIVDPWIALSMPALVALCAGFASGGRLDVAGAAALGGALFIGTLACLGSAIGFAVAWLFRSRRRSEWFTLVFVIGLSLVSFVPLWFSTEIEGRKRQGSAAARGPDRVQADLDRALAWTTGLPSELYGSAVRHALDRRPVPAGVALAGLAGQVVLLFLVSSVVHGRLVGSVETRGSRRGAGRSTGLTPRVPLAGAAVSAVATAQFRTAVRSVRGRVIVLLPGPLLAIMVVALRAIPDEAPWLTSAAGHRLLGVAIVFAIYSMQAFSMNLFGSDRAGLTQQFLAPVSDVALARGKIIGCGMVLGLTVALCAAAVLLVAPSGSPALWLATLLAGLATYLLTTPAMVWLSALFPVASDLGKTGSGGNPHGLSMLAGTLLTGLAAAPAAAILIGIEVAFGRPWMALAAMTGWTAIAWAISMPLVTLAARTIGHRRENLALVAQGR